MGWKQRNKKKTQRTTINEPSSSSSTQPPIIPRNPRDVPAETSNRNPPRPPRNPPSRKSFKKFLKSLKKGSPPNPPGNPGPSGAGPSIDHSNCSFYIVVNPLAAFMVVLGALSSPNMNIRELGRIDVSEECFRITVNEDEIFCILEMYPWSDGVIEYRCQHPKANMVVRLTDIFDQLRFAPAEAGIAIYHRVYPPSPELFFQSLNNERNPAAAFSVRFNIRVDNYDLCPYMHHCYATVSPMIRNNEPLTVSGELGLKTVSIRVGEQGFRQLVNAISTYPVLAENAFMVCVKFLSKCAESLLFTSALDKHVVLGVFQDQFFKVVLQFNNQFGALWYVARDESNGDLESDEIPDNVPAWVPADIPAGVPAGIPTVVPADFPAGVSAE